MAASDRLSSYRPPRSVTRVAAISWMISSRVSAVERVSPVQDDIADRTAAYPVGVPLFLLVSFS